MPKGPVRDVLTTMTKTWVELDQLEKRNGLSFLRQPDPGFVWAAYRWVRGASLEDVLDSVPGLTPGDFVRAVKQLIDILDQIAGAANRTERPSKSADDRPADAVPAAAAVSVKDRDVAATARAAIDAMKRGIVAYSMVTD
jgi:ATP-dependent RNA helicase HelY